MMFRPEGFDKNLIFWFIDFSGLVHPVRPPLLKGVSQLGGGCVAIHSNQALRSDDLALRRRSGLQAAQAVQRQKLMYEGWRSLSLPSAVTQLRKKVTVASLTNASNTPSGNANRQRQSEARPIDIMQFHVNDQSQHLSRLRFHAHPRISPHRVINQRPTSLVVDDPQSLAITLEQLQQLENVLWAPVIEMLSNF
jgi:hypothetical protein